MKVFTVLIILLFSSNYYSQQLKYSEFIHANNIKMWVDAYGAGSHDPYTDDAGLFWGVDSQGKELTAIFTDGPLFGFKLRDSIHVHGATYRYGLNPIPFGPSTDNRLQTIAKIARNWDNETNPELKNVYEFYHDNYPAFHGAPFTDKNGNGLYDPDHDTPEYLGDETLWWKSFPNDSNRTKFLFGSPRVNLEIQTTVWAENSRFPDVVYKEYLFINHEPDTMKDFYFAYWSDPDAGNHKDDYVGVDTSLNMMFAYNGDDYDEDAYLERPASVGYLLLDGPVIQSNELDTARFNGVLNLYKKNQNLHSFYFYENNSGDDDYPFEVYSFTLQSYNQMQGLLWNGDYIIDPVTNEITKFSLNGDPIEGTGWYEGDGNPYNLNPGDRRMMMSAGPFNMAPGDTNSVTFAICLARDTGRLNSLAKLKQLAADVKYHWLYEVERTFPEPEIIREEPEIPTSFVISNNYPNPFNNATSINLELPQSGNIKIVVFNALGEVVSEITEHSPTAGYKSIQINSSGLSSGVYYYTVLFRGETKLGKFVMLK